MFGYESYADFTLRRRMAKNTANTTRFLDEVKQAVTDSERRDIADMREAKAKHLGQPLDKTTVARWDVAFYTERLRKERFTVDEESFRPYFPPQESLQFVMRIAETMFGIKYTPVPAKLWHPEAQAYAVSDAATGKPIDRRQLRRGRMAARRHRRHAVDAGRPGALPGQGRGTQPRRSGLSPGHPPRVPKPPRHASAGR